MQGTLFQALLFDPETLAQAVIIEYPEGAPVPTVARKSYSITFRTLRQ
jgi:hypothetical protein